MNQTNNSTEILCEERSIEVNQLNYAYKHWRRSDAQPGALKILALHGWLDNANSFDILAPQLLSQLNAELIALDLAGHGLSGHRHIQAHYNIWDDLADIALLTEKLAWQEFIILGHSRGAMISTLFTTSILKKVQALVLLDGLLPIAIESEEAPIQLMRFVKQKIKKPRSSRSYATLDEAIAARCKAANMLEETARPIIDRAMAVNTQKHYVWRSDPRLTHPSAFKLNRQQNDAFFKRIQAPTLLLLAARGLAEHTQLCVSSIDVNEHVQYRHIDATHHMHLELAASQLVNKHVVEFLNTITQA